MARALIVLVLYFAAWGAIRLSQPSRLDLAAEIAIPPSVFYDVMK